MSFLVPSQNLELNVISAQDLASVAGCMKTYAVAWIHPDRKLTTRVDNTGGTNPTWNAKFVFRLDEEFVYNDLAMVVIEIYASHWFKDIHVGTVQVLITDLIAPGSEMRLVTLEVLRASGRPQGILNIAVGILDGSMRSMPLYTPVLFEEEKSFNQRSFSSKHLDQLGNSKAEIRRLKSDSSSMVKFERSGMMKGYSKRSQKKIGTESYNTSNSGFAVETESQVTTSMDKNDFSSDSQMVMYVPPNKTPAKTPKMPAKEKPVLQDYKWAAGTSPYRIQKNLAYGTPMRTKNVGITPKKMNVEYGTPMRSRKVVKPIITDSELGPSVSVVAGMIARERALAGKDAESTVISVDAPSVEGLQSKLERWRADLPPIATPVPEVGSGYQPNSIRQPNSAYKPISAYKPNGAHGGGGGLSIKHPKSGGKVKMNRHTDGGSRGLFSCFSNICGAECSFVCGSDAAKNSKKK